MNVKSSADLLLRLQQGDQEALAEVYDTYAPALYRYAYRLTGHDDSAQDIVAETFLRLLTALKNGSGPETYLSAWLYRVAHNLVVDFYRRQPEQEPVPLDDVQLPVAEQGEAALLAHEEAGRVRAALWRLTPLQQQIISLRFLEGLSLEEVGQVVQRNLSAVKALQHRAIESLRRMLEDPDDQTTL